MTERLNMSSAPVDIKEVEPNTFFAQLKKEFELIDTGKLSKEREVILRQMKTAEELNQTQMMLNTTFAWRVLLAEEKAIQAGITKWCDAAMVEKFIDNVRPAGSVRICWLEQYPRVIPHENAEKIKEVAALGIFDHIAIVYTDFVGEATETPAQKEVVRRNKDPIAFGVFFDKKTKQRHDRMFVITDWEDEFCDLTFTRMTERIAQLPGVDKTRITGDLVTITEEDVQRIVNKAHQAHEKAIGMGQQVITWNRSADKQPSDDRWFITSVWNWLRGKK